MPGPVPMQGAGTGPCPQAVTYHSTGMATLLVSAAMTAQSSFIGNHVIAPCQPHEACYTMDCDDRIAVDTRSTLRLLPK